MSTNTTAVADRLLTAEEIDQAFALTFENCICDNRKCYLCPLICVEGEQCACKNCGNRIGEEVDDGVEKFTITMRDKAEVKEEKSDGKGKGGPVVKKPGRKLTLKINPKRGTVRFVEKREREE